MRGTNESSFSTTGIGSQTLQTQTPASSESLTHHPPLPAPVNISNNSTESIDLGPPKAAKLLAEYNQIVSLPGPKCMKQKRIRELYQRENIIIDDPNLRREKENELRAKMLRTAREPKPKKPRKERNNNTESLSSQSNTSSIITVPIRGPNVTLNSLPISPRSQQMVLKSPLLLPSRTEYRVMSSSPSSSSKNTSSSSSTSNDNVDPILAPTARVAPPILTPPILAPPKVVPSKVAKPPAKPAKTKAVTNVHSNAGAPRRITVDTRPNTKNLGG